jgi:hypothetical protein
MNLWVLYQAGYILKLSNPKVLNKHCAPWTYVLFRTTVFSAREVLF